MKLNIKKSGYMLINGALPVFYKHLRVLVIKNFTIVDNLRLINGKKEDYRCDLKMKAEWLEYKASINI